jgi:hypothetical protein
MRLRRRPHDILACPRCDSRLVQPLAARRRRDGDWHLDRGCPECEWRGAARCSADAYAEFDAAQRAARAALTALLADIERAQARDTHDPRAQPLRRGDAGPGSA